MIKFVVNDCPVKVFPPGEWGDFPVVMIEVNRGWDYDEVTKTILRLINRYQLSPFSCCFVLAVRNRDRFELIGFVEADVKFKKEIEKDLEVKNLKWLVINVCEKRELGACLKTFFKVTNEIRCIWK